MMKSLSGAAAAEAEAAEAEAAEATINSLVKRRTVNYHCELTCWEPLVIFIGILECGRVLIAGVGEALSSTRDSVVLSLPRKLK